MCSGRAGRSLVDHVTTDEELIRTLPHLQLSWNSPLSASHADRLISSLAPTDGSRLLDLGCGWGGLLLRALTQTPRATGTGVDQNPVHLERGRGAARELRLSERVRFERDDIVRYSGVGDRVICIGADHAWGSVGSALVHLRQRVESGGRLLFGCGYWSHRPSPQLIQMFGELPISLDATFTTARASGWTIRAADSADEAEWDDFESGWRLDLEEIGRSEPNTDRGRQALRLAAQRREEYDQGYRGVLGFAYLLLERGEDGDPEASTD